MTALVGSPVIKGLTEERLNGGPILLRLHYSADPDKDPATEVGKRFVEECAKDHPDGGTQSPGWRREMEMDPLAGAGELVFPFLDRLAPMIFTHGFRPQAGDAIFAGFDVGRANPTALLLAAMRNIEYFGKPYKALYFFWEYYKRHALLNDMAMNVVNCPWYPAIQWIACDPSIWDKNQYKKDGMTSLAQMLQDEVEPPYRIDKMMKAHGRNDQVFIHKFSSLAVHTVKNGEGADIHAPLVFIDEDGCPNCAREFRGLKYREVGMDKNASEKIVDKDNHLFDCAKYIVLSDPETHETVVRHPEGTIGAVREQARVASFRYGEYED